MRLPCAEKSKFENLINETYDKLQALPPEVVYPNGMTAMEFAKDLAQKANNNG